MADLEATAMRRIPGFLRDYLINGIGQGVAVEKNRQALNDVESIPSGKAWKMVENNGFKDKMKPFIRTLGSVLQGIKECFNAVLKS